MNMKINTKMLLKNAVYWGSV